MTRQVSSFIFQVSSLPAAGRFHFSSFKAINPNSLTMATIQKFEDLIAWQKAREINKRIHVITSRPAFAREFKFKDQMNRSSGSVMDNIAEGFGRKGNTEFRNFLTIANGSLMELKSQMYRAEDMNLIDQEEVIELMGMISEVARIIHGLILHLNRTGHNGLKFK